jgi:hypothetical protein
MDRTALLNRAAEVRRRLFASLPWGVRFAIIFTEAASAVTEQFGRQVGAFMLMAGIQDMPDPGPRWNPKAPNPGHLPAHYMQGFMDDCYGLLLHKYRDPDLVNEAMSEYMLGLHQGKPKLDPKMKRSQAESFIKHGMVWAAQGLARTKLREQAREESTEDVEEGSKQLSRDLEDPNALKKYERILSDRMWNEWMDYLAKHIHPDMPLYIDLRFKGFSNDEIVGAPKKGQPETMLPHYKAEGHPTKSDPTFWGDKYFKQVKDVSEQFFQQKRKSDPEEFEDLFSGR